MKLKQFQIIGDSLLYSSACEIVFDYKYDLSYFIIVHSPSKQIFHFHIVSLNHEPINQATASDESIESPKFAISSPTNSLPQPDKICVLG